tara:strand:- start:4599 stop:4766 length:168 start_codon:yes stop_codon:yes gene_type:complete
MEQTPDPTTVEHKSVEVGEGFIDVYIRLDDGTELIYTITGSAGNYLEGFRSWYWQ